MVLPQEKWICGARATQKFVLAISFQLTGGGRTFVLADLHRANHEHREMHVAPLKESDTLNVLWVIDHFFKAFLTRKHPTKDSCDFYQLNTTHCTHNEFLVVDFGTLLFFFSAKYTHRPVDDLMCPHVNRLSYTRESKPFSWIGASKLCLSENATLPIVNDKSKLLQIVGVALSQCAPVTEALFIGFYFTDKVRPTST